MKKVYLAYIRLFLLWTRQFARLRLEGLHWYSAKPIIDGGLWSSKDSNLTRLELEYSKNFQNKTKSFSFARQVHRLWNQAEIIEAEGNFHTAVSLKQEILETSWQKYGLKQGEFVPPFIESDWLHAFGHQANLGFFSLAQQLGFIHPARRTILDLGNANINRPILQGILANFNIWKSKGGANILEHPDLFCLTEKMTMLATPDGFKHFNEIMDKVLLSINTEDTRQNFDLGEEEVVNARKQLSILGLPDDAWFVGLHVRQDYRMRERDSDISTYIESIKFITSEGGWVIRIGDSRQQPLPYLPNVINLIDESETMANLHDYVLAKCRFFMGNSSGPVCFPLLFGIPTLISNVVAIGKNTWNGASPTISIPKVWVDLESKRELSILESLELGLGFVELSSSKNGNFRTRDNSSEEILLATEELYSYLDNKQVSLSTTQNSLLMLRKKLGAVSFGLFAESFLANH
jgi:putative glycosyltransferase (TIGR04372 family)